MFWRVLTILSWNRRWMPHQQLEIFILTGHGTFWFPPMLPMTDPCQRFWHSCFLYLECFCLWPGWSPAGKLPLAGWGHGGVWLCAGLQFVGSSMVSLRAGSHCIMILFQETRASCHSSVSTNEKTCLERCIVVCKGLFSEFDFYFSLTGKEYSKGDSRYVM